VESIAVLERPSKTGSPQPAQQKAFPSSSHWQHSTVTVGTMSCKEHTWRKQKMCNYHMIVPATRVAPLFYQSPDGMARRDDWGAGKAIQKAIQQLLRRSVTSSRALRKVLGPVLIYRIVTSA